MKQWYALYVFCILKDSIHKATSILFSVLRANQYYSSRSLKQIKEGFLRNNHWQRGITHGPMKIALKCKSRRGRDIVLIERKNYIFVMIKL